MLSNVRVGTKLMAGFLAVSAVALVVGVMGYRGMGVVMAAYDDAAEVRLPGVRALLTIQERTTALKSAERTLLNPRLTLEERDHEHENFRKRTRAAEEAMKAYDGLPRRDDEEALWREVQTRWAAYQRELGTYRALSMKFTGFGVLDPANLAADLAQREIEHREWIFDLSETVVEMVPFRRTTDPTRCAMGRWLESYTTANPGLAAAMKEFRRPHERVHRSAEKIVSILNGPGTDEDKRRRMMEVFDGETMPAFREVLAIFARMRKVAAEADGMLAALNEQAETRDRKAYKALEQSLGDLVSLAERIAAERMQETDRAVATAGKVVIGAIGAGVAVAVLLGFVFSRAITRPLQDGVRAAERLAAGDLTADVRVPGNDEVGQVMAAIRAAIEKLREVVAAVQAAAGQVAAGSQEMSSGAQQLSQGATEQAASIEE
ncbi:MAG: methyl-accepting chemotaxis protein, partial [Candidatus Dadabacteria bacterium]